MTPLALAAEQELKACPFCGCDMHIDGDGDWHHIDGKHDVTCVFAGQAAMTVPGNALALVRMCEAWNTRQVHLPSCASFSREAALRDAACACMKAQATGYMVRFFGETAHYLACRDAVMALIPQHYVGAQP